MVIFFDVLLALIMVVPVDKSFSNCILICRIHLSMHPFFSSLYINSFLSQCQARFFPLFFFVVSSFPRYHTGFFCKQFNMRAQHKPLWNHINYHLHLSDRKEDFKKSLQAFVHPGIWAFKKKKKKFNHNRSLGRMHVVSIHECVRIM